VKDAVKDTMKTFLETDRLRLREFEACARDEQLLLELDSDPRVMRYLSDGAPTPIERVREWVPPRFMEHYSHHPKFGVFAAHLRQEPSAPFIGWFILRPAIADHPAPETAGQIELGYRLRYEAWGKGYATEGSRALLDYAFRVAHAPLVMATAMKDNRGSRHVMEKLGLVWERDYVETRFPGANQAAVKYALRSPAP
jgi:RimJ/RimL family protein N-acetyltransferase